MTEADRRRIAKFVSTVTSSYGLSDSELGGGGVFVTASKNAPSLFRYATTLPEFRMVGFGSITAIVASAEYLRYALSNRHPGADWFTGATLAEISTVASQYEHRLGAISHKFVAQGSAVVPEPSGKLGLRYRQVEGDDIRALYDETHLFRNALSYGERPTRPDWRAIAASDGDRVVGVAGASEDAQGLYQIGVDVIPEYRKRGIGTAIVSMLARSIIEDDAVPFYSASSCNIISQRLCLSAGFIPVCVEIYAHNQPRRTRNPLGEIK